MGVNVSSLSPSGVTIAFGAFVALGVITGTALGAEVPSRLSSAGATTIGSFVFLGVLCGDFVAVEVDAWSSSDDAFLLLSSLGVVADVFGAEVWLGVLCCVSWEVNMSSLSPSGDTIAFGAFVPFGVITGTPLGAMVSSRFSSADAATIGSFVFFGVLCGDFLAVGVDARSLSDIPAISSDDLLCTSLASVTEPVGVSIVFPGSFEIEVMSSVFVALSSLDIFSSSATSLPSASLSVISILFAFSSLPVSTSLELSGILVFHGSYPTNRSTCQFTCVVNQSIYFSSISL